MIRNQQWEPKGLSYSLEGGGCAAEEGTDRWLQMLNTAPEGNVAY